MLIPHPRCPQRGPLDLIETGKGLKVQTDKPHLVSLGSGRLSTAITLLPLEEGRCPADAPALGSGHGGGLRALGRPAPPLCSPCRCLPGPVR